MEPVQIFKALADETRFKLVKLLLTRDLCVGALAKQLSISEAAVSQHLKSLREAGLVRGEKRGYWTHYAVEKEKLEELTGLLGGLTRITRVRINKPNGKYQQPEKLKSKPAECTLGQIKECHGDKEHPCGKEIKKE